MRTSGLKMSSVLKCTSPYLCVLIRNFRSRNLDFKNFLEQNKPNLLVEIRIANTTVCPLTKNTPSIVCFVCSYFLVLEAKTAFGIFVLFVPIRVDGNCRVSSLFVWIWQLSLFIRKSRLCLLVGLKQAMRSKMHTLGRTGSSRSKRLWMYAASITSGTPRPQASSYTQPPLSNRTQKKSQRPNREIVRGFQGEKKIINWHEIKFPNENQSTSPIRNAGWQSFGCQKMRCFKPPVRHGLACEFLGTACLVCIRERKLN